MNVFHFFFLEKKPLFFVKEKKVVKVAKRKVITVLASGGGEKQNNDKAMFWIVEQELLSLISLACASLLHIHSTYSRLAHPTQQHKALFYSRHVNVSIHLKHILWVNCMTLKGEKANYSI